MRNDNSATVARRPPISLGTSGLAWGFLGVLAFSLTVPLTRSIVGDGQMSPLFVGAGRVVIAAAIAGSALLMTRARLPQGRQWLSVAVVAIGCVIGFPLLTSYALTQTPASHAAVVIGLLPAATAVASVLRTGERPRPAFWCAAVAGAVAAVVFAIVHSGGIGQLGPADGLIFAAVVICAIGYAEGAVLSRSLGAWQTISWALVMSAPVMIVLTVSAVVQQPQVGGPLDWLSFAYLGVVSMFLGFIAWYRGLAIGPLAPVSQIQLVQPVLSIGWAALLLHEHLSWQTLLGALAVIGCALIAVRARRSPPRPDHRADSSGAGSV